MRNYHFQIEPHAYTLFGMQGNLSAKLSPTARVGYGRSDGQPNNSAPDPAKWTHLAVCPQP